MLLPHQRLWCCWLSPILVQILNPRSRVRKIFCEICDATRAVCLSFPFALALVLRLSSNRFVAGWDTGALSNQAHLPLIFESLRWYIARLQNNAVATMFAHGMASTYTFTPHGLHAHAALLHRPAARLPSVRSRLQIIAAPASRRGRRLSARAEGVPSFSSHIIMPRRSHVHGRSGPALVVRQSGRESLCSE